MKAGTYDRLVSWLVPLEGAYLLSIGFSCFFALLWMCIWLAFDFVSFWLTTFFGICVIVAVAVGILSKKLIPRLLVKHIRVTLEARSPTMSSLAD